MPTPELEEFGKNLVKHVRDMAIRSCDTGLASRSLDVFSRRWRAVKSPQKEEIARLLIPQCVDQALYFLLYAIDDCGLQLSYTASNGKVIDIGKEGYGELAGWYIGAEGWVDQFSEERSRTEKPPGFDDIVERNADGRANPIDLITRAIRKEVLLAPKIFADISTEDVLRHREDPRYQREWAVLRDELETMSLSEDDERRVHELARVASLLNDPDCSLFDLLTHIGYDFELIGKASICLPDSKFAAALLASYLAGVIPHRTVAPSEKPLRALIATLDW